ncbi:MAG: type II secretion system protein GspG [Planctomycetota bacterium]|jgi:general secretion pathway protein G
MTTKANIKILHSAVTQFKLDTGRFPTEEEGLQALVERPANIEHYDPAGYLKTPVVPKDAWGNNFDYKLDPESGKPFVIISYGADAKPEGTGKNRDLYSTDP